MADSFDGCAAASIESCFYQIFECVFRFDPTDCIGRDDSWSIHVEACGTDLLIVAIILTGVGAAMSLNMRIVPNPGDGVVQAIADCIHKNVGFTKNCFDLVNITISTLVGLLAIGRLAGVGIGTVFAVIGVGRAIAVFNHFTYDKMAELSGTGEE